MMVVEFMKSDVVSANEKSSNSDSSIEEKDWEDFLETEEQQTDEELTYEDKTTEIDIPEDPYQVRTQRTFANNPYNKAVLSLALVGGGIFIFMQFIRLITGGYTTGSISKSIPPAETVTEEEVSVVEPEEVTSNESLEMHEALKEQSNEIKEVEKMGKVKIARQTSDSATATDRTPSKISQNQKISQPPPPKSQPVTVRQVSYSPPPSSIKTRPQPAVSVISPPIVEKEKEDPMKQWLLAANMGHYEATNLVDVSVVSNNNEVKEYPAYPAVNPKQVISVSYQQKATASQIDNSWKEIEGTPNLTAQADEMYSITQASKPLASNRLKRGESIKAEIELPIIWMLGAGEYNQQRDYLIRLKSPLKNEAGSEIVPKGSIAVVKAQRFFGNSGFIQLEVTSLVIEENGVSREYNIPKDSLIVLNKKGGVLEAKAEKAGNFEGEAAAFILSGIARAASISNSPTSSRYSPFGNSVEYGDRDVVGGFIEGAADSAVDSIRERRSDARARARKDSTVYTIDAGTDVQIIVNKSFSLE